MLKIDVAEAHGRGKSNSSNKDGTTPAKRGRPKGKKLQQAKQKAPAEVVIEHTELEAEVQTSEVCLCYRVICYRVLALVLCQLFGCGPIALLCYEHIAV